MPETFNITFSGLEAASAVVNTIRTKIEGLNQEAQSEDGLNRTIPQLHISSDQIQPVLQQFLWDTMNEINKQATTSEPDFDGAVP